VINRSLKSPKVQTAGFHTVIKSLFENVLESPRTIMQVYLHVNEQQVGPYTPDQLQQLLAAGQIPGETPAWHEGLTEWSTVSSVLQTLSVPLAVVPPPPPPTPPVQAGTQDVNCLNRRVFGGLIDNILFTIIVFPVFLIIKIIGPAFPERAFSLLGWLLAAPFVAYFISSRFQATPGMTIFGIIAINQQGQSISYGRAFLRHLVSLLSYSICLTGYLMWNFNKKRQTLHDMVAGSLVVARPPDFKPIKSPWIPFAAMLIPSVLITIGLLIFTNVGQTFSDQSTDTDNSSQVSQRSSSPPSSDQTQNNPPATTPDNTTSTSQAAPDSTQVTDDDNVKEVKDGTLAFDKSVKVGPALEGYSCFNKVTWKSFDTSQGRTVVEATAGVKLQAYINTSNDEDIPFDSGIIPAGNVLSGANLDTLLKKVKRLEITYTVQFQLSKTDNSFEVAYSGYNVKTTQLNTGEPIEQEVKDDDAQNSLQAIFANKPDQKITALLLLLANAPTPPPSPDTNAQPPSNTNAPQPSDVHGSSTVPVPPPPAPVSSPTQTNAVIQNDTQNSAGIAPPITPPSSDTQQRSTTTIPQPPPDTQNPASDLTSTRQESSNPGAKQTKEEWKAQLAQALPEYATTGKINVKKATLIKLCGTPEKTEAINDDVNELWYYPCKDGFIKLQLNSGWLKTNQYASGKVIEQ
jgi:uncharacterized RDD family membrane protein YckC